MLAKSFNYKELRSCLPTLLLQLWAEQLSSSEFVTCGDGDIESENILTFWRRSGIQSVLASIDTEVYGYFVRLYFVLLW